MIFRMIFGVMAVTSTFKKLDSDLNLNPEPEIYQIWILQKQCCGVRRSRGLLAGAGADLKFDLASEKRND